MSAAGDGALRGRRVLELADEKGVYCGKLLADMGADVVSIEPPGGCAMRGYAPCWLDAPCVWVGSSRWHKSPEQPERNYPSGTLFRVLLYVATTNNAMVVDIRFVVLRYAG